MRRGSCQALLPGLPGAREIAGSLARLAQQFPAGGILRVLLYAALEVFRASR